MFSGHTYEPVQDGERLAGQLERVKRLMLDGEWRDLATISAAVKGSEAGCSARLRDLRKKLHGGYIVDRRRVSGGLFEYRVLSPELAGQRALFAPPAHMPERVR